MKLQCVSISKEDVVFKDTQKTKTIISLSKSLFNSDLSFFKLGKYYSIKLINSNSKPELKDESDVKIEIKKDSIRVICINYRKKGKTFYTIDFEDGNLHNFHLPYNPDIEDYELCFVTLSNKQKGEKTE